VSNNSKNAHRGEILTIDAWNTETTEGETTNSFNCEANSELYQYFLLQEPIAVLLLIDKQAKWNMYIYYHVNILRIIVSTTSMSYGLIMIVSDIFPLCAEFFVYRS
jgi:hypothetical protein